MKIRSRTWKEWKSDIFNIIDWKFILFFLLVGVIGYYFIFNRSYYEIPKDANINQVAFIKSVQEKFTLTSSKMGSKFNFTGWQIAWEYNYADRAVIDSSFIGNGILNKSQKRYIGTLKRGDKVDIKISNENKSYLIIKE